MKIVQKVQNPRSGPETGSTAVLGSERYMGSGHPRLGASAGFLGAYRGILFLEDPLPPGLAEKGRLGVAAVASLPPQGK